MPSARGRRWVVPRRDLAAGGATLARLEHPLLPQIVRARPADDGLRLTLTAPDPAPLARLATAERRGYLARLAALLGFLRFHGLGVASTDVGALGAWSGEPARPAPGAPPVPAWRAAPPALAVAACAVRLAGRTIACRDVSSLRAAVVEALERGLPEDVAADVVTALRALDGDGRPEALAAELSRRGGATLPRDLAGLAYPCPFVELPGGDGPTAAVGPAAEWIARGAARRDEAPAFVECSPGSPLEDGAALRKLARALDGDPRAGDIRALADGARAPRRDDGPAVSLLALGADRWDARSRRALSGALPAMGFRVFEVCTGPLRPWEERGLLGFRIAEGDAASLVYLPFVSLAAALEAWREAGAAAAVDPAGFLETARALTARFDPRTGAATPERRRPGRRPDPVVEAAALLADGFDLAEATAVAGATPERAAAALEEAARTGLLVRTGGAAFRFGDETERARLAARIPRAARFDAVARLEALGLPPNRFAPAALARGEPRDLAAARALLDGADGASAAGLFARAPRGEPDLGAADAPRSERIAAARALARLGQPGRALALCPGGDDDEDLARAALLVELRRHADARRILDRLLAPSAAAPRVEALLLRAELDERAHRYKDAAAGLAAAERLLGGLADRELASRAARTAGYLANDLGRTGEAIALFRRSGELAPGARARADATYDVAHAALDGGRMDVAARELDDALELYAAAGEEARYLSALGNRIDLFLRSGDAAAARPVLERVLGHERAAGRGHQVLFAIPAAQEIALLDGDAGAAAAAFREAQELAAGADAAHPAWREILLFEAERRLASADAEGAAPLLAQAAAIPDNRSRTEPRRRRLLASANRDLGRRCEPLDVDARERALLAAEDALAAGTPPADDALGALESLAGSRESGAAVRRLLEWAGRFPAAFAGPAGAPLARLGRRAAARAGLARAEERFASFLERRGPEPPVSRAPEPRADVVAEDASTRAVFDEVARVAPSVLALLVRGESGTGKEIVAREAHRLSRRRGPFVAVNLAALPSTLAESELFGHARGAFSGADRDRRGLVEEASGGTLFLDEIGDLPPALQGKLLRVLQEGEVRRLGETAVRRVDLRVVAATHRDLQELVARGEFRGDLYYRIAGHEVVLRPLRERPRDRARLIARALDGRASLAPAAAAALDRWRWPGNARELLTALESARTLASPSRVIGLEHLPRPIREAAASRPAARRWKDRLDDARREAIASTLDATGGRRAEAARLLGISRQSLLYEMKKLGIR